jgi:hypothetical protein
VPFELGYRVPRADWAIACFERLRLLELQHGSPSKPLMMPLAQPALSLIESLGRDAQARQKEAAGLMCSALGKARGQALRLSLVLELLWWSAEDSAAAPPKEISKRAFEAAAILVGEYFMPMAERVYGDAAVGRSHRNAASLARWILREQAHEVHVREVQRKRLSDLTTAEVIHNAAAVLVDADWLRSPPQNHAFGPRPRLAPTLLTRLFSMRHIRPVVTLFDGVTDCDTVRHCWGRWRRPRHFPRCVERCYSLSHLNAIRCGTPNPTDHSQRRQCLLCPRSTDENNGFALWSVPRAAALEPPAQTICERRSRPRGHFWSGVNRPAVAPASGRLAPAIASDNPEFSDSLGVLCGASNSLRSRTDSRPNTKELTRLTSRAIEPGRSTQTRMIPVVSLAPMRMLRRTDPTIETCAASEILNEYPR